MNCGHKLVTILSICIILNIPEFGYSEDKNTFREILSDTSIVGLSHWDIAYDVFLVVVKSSVKEIKGEKIPSRNLTFFRREGQFFHKEYEYSTFDNFKEMFSLGVTFMTLWEAGSGYPITAFATKNGKIFLALETGSSGMPEIADLDNNGQLEIITTDEPFLVDAISRKVISYPKTAKIYELDPSDYKYKLLRKLPWKTRLKDIGIK